MLETVAFAGLANWLITWIIVEGVVFDDLRARLDRLVTGNLAELWHCHLCAGTWVGFLLATVLWWQHLPGPFGAEWFVIPCNGFVYKAVGHLVLEVATLLRCEVALRRAALEAGEAQRQWKAA